MARIRHDMKFARLPRLGEFPGGEHGRHHVIAALRDDAGNAVELARIAHQLVLRLEEALVHEEVAFDPREGEGEMPVRKALHPLRIGHQRKRRPFPDAPGLGAGDFLVFIVPGQPLVIGRHQVAALRLRDRRDEFLPCIGKERVRPLLVEPVQLPLAQREDAAQDDLGHALGVRLRIGQREGGAP